MQITESPCVRICAIDGRTGLCVGCGRTLAEIGAWAALSPEQRSRVMQELPARLAAADPPRPAAGRTGRRRLRHSP